MKGSTPLTAAVLGMALLAGATGGAHAADVMTAEAYAEYLRLFNAGDDRYADIYAPDVVFDHGPYGVLRGRQAIIDFYRDIRTKLQETVTPGAVVIDNANGLMAAELSTRFVAKRDGADLVSQKLNKGDAFTTRGVVIYTLKDGKIVGIRGAASGKSFEPAKR